MPASTCFHMTPVLFGNHLHLSTAVMRSNVILYQAPLLIVSIYQYILIWHGLFYVKSTENV